jgi:hypothetical protein
LSPSATTSSFTSSAAAGIDTTVSAATADNNRDLDVGTISSLVERQVLVFETALATGRGIAAPRDRVWTSRIAPARRRASEYLVGMQRA